MEYISIILNEDAAHGCLADLGRLEAIQFSDVSRILMMEGISKKIEHRADLIFHLGDFHTCS